MTSLTGSDELLTDAGCQTDDAIQVATLTARPCDQSSRSKINYPHLQKSYDERTKAGPAASIDLWYKAKLIMIKMFQSMITALFILQPHRQGYRLTFIRRWKTPGSNDRQQLTINEDIIHKNTSHAEQNQTSLHRMKDTPGGTSVRFKGKQWESSAAICGPALPCEISYPHKSRKKCCLQVRKLLSGHILGIYCAPAVRHPFL